MKTTIRLPLGQFEFIEMTYDTEMTPEAAVEAFKCLKNAYLNDLQEPIGLTDKELDLIVQNMCLGVTTKDGTNLWDKATPEQRKEINRLSRALKRIKAKSGKEAQEDEEYVNVPDGEGPYA